MSLVLLESELRRLFDLEMKKLSEEFETKEKELKEKFNAKVLLKEEEEQQATDLALAQLNRSFDLALKLEKRKQILKYKRELINQIQEKILKDFRSLIEMKMYFDFMEKLLSPFKEEKIVTIFVNEQDVSEIQKMMPMCKVEPLSTIGGGFVIELEHCKVNQSIETLLSINSSTLERLVEKSYGI